MLRTGVTVIALSLGAATAASAQPAIDTLLSSLARQGFGAFEVDRENGQLKVEARRGTIERELTYDAATGKLIKDEVGRRDDRDDRPRRPDRSRAGPRRRPRGRPGRRPGRRPERRPDDPGTTTGTTTAAGAAGATATATTTTGRTTGAIAAARVGAARGAGATTMARTTTTTETRPRGTRALRAGRPGLSVVRDGVTGLSGGGRGGIGTMRRRQMIAGLLLALAAGVPGEAAPLDDIAANLRADGYEVREVSRTWLGRIRIEAVSDRYQREIVFDRVTGEILRDYLTKRRPDRPASDGGAAPAARPPRAPRAGEGAQTAARLPAMRRRRAAKRRRPRRR